MIRQSIVDMWGVDSDLLNDGDWLREILVDALEDCGLEVYGSVVDDINGNSVSVVINLGNAHASLHAFPNNGDVMLDVMTHGDEIDPDKIIECIRRDLKPQESFKKNLVRGIGDIDVE